MKFELVGGKFQDEKGQVFQKNPTDPRQVIIHSEKRLDELFRGKFKWLDRPMEGEEGEEGAESKPVKTFKTDSAKEAKERKAAEIAPPVDAEDEEDDGVQSDRPPTAKSAASVDEEDVTEEFDVAVANDLKVTKVKGVGYTIRDGDRKLNEEPLRTSTQVKSQLAAHCEEEGE